MLGVLLLWVLGVAGGVAAMGTGAVGVLLGVLPVGLLGCCSYGCWVLLLGVLLLLWVLGVAGGAGVLLRFWGCWCAVAGGVAAVGAGCWGAVGVLLVGPLVSGCCCWGCCCYGLLSDP